MKKRNPLIYLLLLVLGFSILSCRSDDDNKLNPYDPNDASVPKISFVTDHPIDTFIDFYIVSKDDFEVDFGDGNKIKQTKSPTDNKVIIVSKLKGKEVKIYAPKASSITKFSILGVKLKNIDVRNASELEEFEVIQNELSSLDISKNTKLSFLDFSENRFKQSTSNAILNALPKRTNDKKGQVWIYYSSKYEQNEMASQQAIDVATAKLWQVSYYSGKAGDVSNESKKSLNQQ
ncbi:hypothetical protein [Soonwooa sp.]|uniref:hypothetical protein n=1 Tax=Soonwooa sp. TaxID=1938592 RepID=UPI002623EE37|nr:hypothetical protein [Soonwooa sp.]